MSECGRHSEMEPVEYHGDPLRRLTSQGYDDYDSPWIDGITDPEEIRRRITGEMPPPTPTPPGGWTPENIGPEIRRLTEASRPIAMRLPIEDAEYCNVCENFPCMGGHPPHG
jgi:hypothetical protein